MGTSKRERGAKFSSKKNRSHHRLERQGLSESIWGGEKKKKTCERKAGDGGREVTKNQPQPARLLKAKGRHGKKKTLQKQTESPNELTQAMQETWVSRPKE